MCFPNFSLVCCWNFFWFYFPVVSDERSQGKVSIPGPLVTALIFRANLQIAVCRFFQLSMLRFTVWRIGLFWIIRQQFWNEGKTVNWQNWSQPQIPLNLTGSTVSMYIKSIATYNIMLPLPYPSNAGSTFWFSVSLDASLISPKAQQVLLSL